MSGRSIPSDFVKSILQNGIGRYVCQLQRLTLKFCKSNAASRGVRDFIENDLLDFTRNNRGIVFYLQPRRHRAPVLVGEYLNQNVVSIPAANRPRQELCKWVHHLRCRSGNEVVRLRKTWHTDTPSVQGIWTPLTNADTSLGITEFPAPKLYAVRRMEQSATEKLVEISEQKRIGGGLSRGSKVAIGKN